MLKFFCCFIFVANVITFSAEVGASGFDSIECDPHSSRARTGRARLIASIPCDLAKQSYCNLPGEFYPWNAVKKFVYENQGLVRRMYGDLRHIFVMQSELENEIDSDDMKHFADKYSKAFNSQQKKHQSNDEKHNNKRQMKAKKVATDRKNYRSEGEPYFRPAQRPSAINSKQKTKPPRVNEQVDNNVLNVDDLIKNNEEQIADNMRSKTEITSSSSLSSSTTRQTSTISTSTITADSTNNNNRSMSTSSTETPQSSSTNSATSTPSSTSSLSPQTSLDSNVNGNDQSRDSIPSSNKDKVVIDDSNNSSTTTTFFVSTSTSTSNIPPQTHSTTISTETDEIEAIVEEIEKEVDTELRDASSVFSFDSNNSTSSSSSSSVFSNDNTREPPTTTTEAQLFQDTIFKEKEPPEPVIINRRGVNACPVKEEVVAPFWANNTRGEVLALLNVYPFEQYIHWEKCTHEHEQMYCRRGCKCEQQHRLHRLLAYNPLDACRGIFSDWFRFPSCCICKCYDIPFDFRVTSRSPRGTDKLIDDDDDNNSSEVEQMDIEVNVETDTDNDSNDGRITFSASDDVDINFYNQDHEDDF